MSENKETLRVRLAALAKRMRNDADMMLICEAIGALKSSENALRAVAPKQRPPRDFVQEARDV